MKKMSEDTPTCVLSTEGGLVLMFEQKRIEAQLQFSTKFN